MSRLPHWLPEGPAEVVSTPMNATCRGVRSVCWRGRCVLGSMIVEEVWEQAELPAAATSMLQQNEECAKIRGAMQGQLGAGDEQGMLHSECCFRVAVRKGI